MVSGLVDRYGCRKSQAFVTAYILYGLALISVMGVAYSKIYALNQQARIVQETVDELVSQVEVIRSKILLCAAIYPDGDHGQFNTRHAYPAPPNSQANRAVLSSVTCPGSPGGTATLAQLSDGVPLPVAPPEFNPWVYEHTAPNGVRLILSPKVGGGGSSVRTRLLRQLTSIATVSGDDVLITVLQ